MSLARIAQPLTTCFLYASAPLVTLNYVRTRLALDEELTAATADVVRLEKQVIDGAIQRNLLPPPTPEHSPTSSTAQ